MADSTRVCRQGAKQQYVPSLRNKLGIKNMRKGTMSEVMAETSKGHALNVPGSDTKLWLVLREMLGHCPRKVCDAWRAQPINECELHIRPAEKAVRTQTMFESIV